MFEKRNRRSLDLFFPPSPSVRNAFRNGALNKPPDLLVVVRCAPARARRGGPRSPAARSRREGGGRPGARGRNGMVAWRRQRHLSLAHIPICGAVERAPEEGGGRERLPTNLRGAHASHCTMSASFSWFPLTGTVMQR